MKCKECGEEREKYIKNLCRQCYDKQWNEKNKEYVKVINQKNRKKILEQHRQWRKNNPEKLKEIYKRDYQKNKEKILERNKIWHDNNKEKVRVQHKKWRENNREKDKEIKQRWKEKNPTYYSTYLSYREHNDINFKIKMNLSGLFRTAVKRQRTIKLKKLLDILGCSIYQCREHIEKQFKPNMSWGNYGQWHIDHKKPCSKFNLVDIEQQKLCFHYTNLQPLWAEENWSKGAKYIET